MLCIDIESNEAQWIIDAILDKLENIYRGVQPDRDKLINEPMEKFAEDISLEEWRTLQELYKKLT